jgi:hypothetical protein
MRTGQFDHAMMLTMTKDDIDTSTMLGRFLWLVKHRAGDNQRELSRMIGKESEGFIGAKIAAFKKDPNAAVECGIRSHDLEDICNQCAYALMGMLIGVVEPVGKRRRRAA